MQCHICMRKGFLINDEMLKYLTIYQEAVSHMYLRNFIFFFISVKLTWKRTVYFSEAPLPSAVFVHRVVKQFGRI
jgi:hypothetical protein